MFFLHTPSLTLRSVLIYGFSIACIVLFVAYILFQARFLLEGPQISVHKLPTVQQERLITLQGRARNIVHMRLNGRQIYTDKDGNFNEALVLENGYTIATLEAEDRYGRKTRHTETFVYTPSEEVHSN